MRIEKESLFVSEENQRLSIKIPASEVDVLVPPTGLTMDMAYEKVGSFGWFNIMVCIPMILIYTTG
jgi:hypothetical protein